MGTPRKKIAVIGSGYCGMVSIASLKEEGIDPICFEKTDKSFGTWCYREESVVGEPSIMPTTTINTSKELNAFSTFPPDKELGNYMRHEHVHKYFQDFAVKRDLFKHVRYNSEVTDVRRSQDYDETGRWTVTVKDTLTGSVSSDVYDGVILSVGHINRPLWPTFKKQEEFKGEIIHTHSLKGVAPYADKNVVVVGMGCSGLDAACEISSVAKQVYVSARSGAHVMSRVGPHGYPMDYILLRRYLTILIDILPTKLLGWGFETLILDPIFNSRLYAVKPQWNFFARDPSVNDQICSKLLSGSVIQKGDIATFTENGVIFEGESEPTPADVVIMATGYTWDFPFLEKDVIIQDGDIINVYKCMWPPALKHATLALVGFFVSFGPGFPMAEMQARYAAYVLAGKGKLPSKEDMLRDIKKRHYKNAQRFKPSPKQSIRADYTQFLDEIGELMGVKPNFLRILFTDPKLFWKLIAGPSVPYQYRLQGPHAWDGAREAIMTCEERVLYPLTKTEVKKAESSFIVFLKKFLLWLIPFV